ncbi:LOW QUALITY PROTEIN: hypothetical protein Cgig2_015224 [Carnegiea gigantea]|uniref:Uncharacterized protein n=1 Tax=Carnegiea gigantea TaxID=171969 RepID=A0A9Q1JK68_9CARY|nr:LOW QUALITY PROTEIN: hypothetical protein Cgig2_015224 [Carnegiea gigantea]
MHLMFLLYIFLYALAVPSNHGVYALSPEAYVTVDALKNFMSTMTDVIMQQVSEQVKKAMEVPTEGCEPSCRRDPAASLWHGERVQEAPCIAGDRWSQEEHREHFIGTKAYPNHRLNAQQSQVPPLCPTRRTLDEQLGLKNKNRPRTLGGRSLNGTGLLNFHEQNGHMSAECQELRKAVHELADKGKIDRFLKWDLRFLRKDHEPAQPNHETRSVPSR